MTFSSTDMREKICRFWKVRDSPRRASWSGARPVTVSPASRMLPSFGV